MKSRIKILDDIIKEDIWASIKIPLLLEILIFTITFIMRFILEQYSIDIIKILELKTTYSIETISYIIEFVGLYIFIITFIFGLSIIYYLNRKKTGLIICLISIVCSLLTSRNISISLVIIQLVNVVIFLVIKKNLNWWKFLIYSLWIFTLIIILVFYYIITLFIGIIFAITLLVIGFDKSYETQNLVASNKGYIDDRYITGS